MQRTWRGGRGDGEAIKHHDGWLWGWKDGFRKEVLLELRLQPSSVPISPGVCFPRRGAGSPRASGRIKSHELAWPPHLFAKVGQIVTLVIGGCRILVDPDARIVIRLGCLLDVFSEHLIINCGEEAG